MFHLSIILYILIGSTSQPAPNSYNTLETTKTIFISYYPSYTMSPLPSYNKRSSQYYLYITTKILMFYFVNRIIPVSGHYHPNEDIYTLTSPAYSI